MRFRPTPYKFMIRIIKPCAFLLAVLVFIPQAQAQTKNTKLTERFDTAADVAILTESQYADIVFEDWNKDEVEVAAIIESEDLSEEEIDQLLKGWQISVQGNSKAVRIVSRGAPRTAKASAYGTACRFFHPSRSASHRHSPNTARTTAELIHSFSRSS